MNVDQSKLNTVQYDVKNLIFAEYNPRELTRDQHQDLKDSITRFGFVDPLIVNTHKERKNILVGGHQRLKIAKELGYKDVPCVEVDLSPDQEKELNVRLNKNTGQWDWDALANHFDVGELLEWGFSEDELQFTEPDVQGLTDDDDVPEVEEAITQQGDLWILGEHRLLCGDATKKEDVERLMDGQKADMVFTDPPYGMNLDTDYSSMKSKMFKGKTGGDYHNPIIGDDKQFNPTLVLNYFDYCKEQFWWGGDYYAEYLPKGNSWIVWDKRLDDSADKMYGSCFELCWSKSKHKRDIARIKWAGIFGTEKEFDKKRHHPTQKPIDLALWFFDKYNGNNVVDLFLGSGSTLIACEKTNRKCYGMEIDPHYCDVIVKRWEDYTGNKAERFEAANA
jgi:DNA modification methylase